MASLDNAFHFSLFITMCLEGQVKESQCISCMGERSKIKILISYPEGSTPLGNLAVYGRMILKWILLKLMECYGLD